MTEHRISPPEVVSERTPRPLAATALSFDLASEVELLKREAAYGANGHNARTLIKDEAFRVVLVVLKQGAKIREHQTYRHIMIHTLTGRLRINVPNESRDLPAGNLLALDRMIPHDVDAMEDSTFLLSVSSSDE
jgi:quercetin dioxygenase-like cupin family protein